MSQSSPQKRTISVFMLTMINITAICNIKNFPLSSLYGLSSLFFFLLAALVYFIPVSLVSAELATGWPQRGIYVWVKEALGEKMGFLAICLQWANNVIWYPTILSFMAATIAYIFNPELASNTSYILTVILGSFWVVTIINLFGMTLSGWISTIGALVGTLVPGALIIFLGFLWYFQGNPSETPITWNAFFPDLTSLNQLVIFSGILLSLAGMEMSSVHALEVKNPQKDYPKSIFISAFLILVLSSLGSLAVAIVVPFKQISLVGGSMEAFSLFLKQYGFSWAIPFIAVVMALGAFSMMSTWVVGPTKGILASALDGDLPPVFQKVNKYGMPTALMIVQAAFVTVLSLAFLLMPDVSSSYWILVNLTVQLYLILYAIIFVSAIKLRYKKPEVKRAYRIPGKNNIGMWITCLAGLFSCIFVFFLGFVPPEQINTGSLLQYELFLLGGSFLFVLVPLIIFEKKKESWKVSKTEIPLK